MKNLLFTLRYDGTDYHGWQVQENANTVQQTFQDAAERICGVRDNVIGCSRTDSGVHADMYCCNMRTESSLSPEKWKSAMNGVLPRDGYHDCGDDYLRALVLCGGAAFSLICHNFLRSGLAVCGSIRHGAFFHPLLFGYKHLARLAALERSDDTLALEFVHEPCGAGITELQFALEKSC